jgi:hypothetical protein
MLLGLVLAVALWVGATAVTAQAQTSGSIGFESGVASGELHPEWTGCRIFFQGKIYECSVSGLDVPMTSVARVTGMINNVKNIADVAGTYKPGEIDEGFGGGMHLKVKNDKGVTMILWPFMDANEIQVTGDGVKIGKIELKK